MPTSPITFGVLLRTLRKRVAMTQGDLAAAVGYSVAAISALEQERRLPLVEFVVQQLVPALALADAPQLATRLVELAAATRGERPPLPLLMESRQLFQRRESRYEVADSAGGLGRLAFLQGDLTQAYTYLLEAVTLAAEFHYQEMVGLWQPLLGLVTLYRGDAAEAHRLLQESLRLCLELKDRFFLTQVYTYLTEIALWAGELVEAEQWLRQSLVYYTEPHRFKLYDVARILIAARLATAQQHYPRAATLFGLAQQISNRLHYIAAGPIRTLADAAMAKVQAALASAVFAEAFAAGQQLTLEEAFATLLPPMPGENATA